jgi:hypothetical protein
LPCVYFVMKKLRIERIEIVRLHMPRMNHIASDLMRRLENGKLCLGVEAAFGQN